MPLIINLKGSHSANPGPATQARRAYGLDEVKWVKYNTSPRVIQVTLEGAIKSMLCSATHSREANGLSF